MGSKTKKSKVVPVAFPPSVTDQDAPSVTDQDAPSVTDQDAPSVTDQDAPSRAASPTTTPNCMAEQLGEAECHCLTCAGKRGHHE